MIPQIVRPPWGIRRCGVAPHDVWAVEKDAIYNHYRAIPLYQLLEVHSHILSLVLRAEQHKPGMLRKLLRSPVRFKNQLKHRRIHYTGTSAYCNIETKCRLKSWYAAQLLARRHHLSNLQVPLYHIIESSTAEMLRTQNPILCPFLLYLPSCTDTNQRIRYGEFYAIAFHFAQFF